MADITSIISKSKEAVIQKELFKEAKRLGFDNPDTALRTRWNDIPEWLRRDLIDLGFNPNE